MEWGRKFGLTFLHMSYWTHDLSGIIHGFTYHKPLVLGHLKYLFILGFCTAIYILSWNHQERSLLYHVCRYGKDVCQLIKLHHQMPLKYVSLFQKCFSQLTLISLCYFLLLSLIAKGVIWPEYICSSLLKISIILYKKKKHIFCAWFMWRSFLSLQNRAEYIFGEERVILKDRPRMN